MNIRYPIYEGVYRILTVLLGSFFIFNCLYLCISYHFPVSSPFYKCGEAFLREEELLFLFTVIINTFIDPFCGF